MKVFFEEPGIKIRTGAGQDGFFQSLTCSDLEKSRVE